MQKSFLIFITTIAFGFCGVANANNLNQLIGVETKKAIAFLNKEDLKVTGYQYKLDKKQIIYADMNNDGKKDAVVALHYCEKQSCHMTTRVFDVAVFLNTGNGNYNYASAYTLGLTGNLSVKNGVINATTLLYNEHEDPTCCPSHKEVIKLKLNNGKLVKIR